MTYELHYDNTNTYIISGTKGMLMFDTGWAGTFMKMCRALGEKNLNLSDIKYLLISHYHPDHMGLAGELAQRGITVAVMESQCSFVHASDDIFERDKRFHYTPISNDDIRIVTFHESRSFLEELGIEGEIIPTPGHSDDSISFLLDSGDVFVGDLYPLYELAAHEETDVQESWQRILVKKPKRIFYGHARTAVLEDNKCMTDSGRQTVDSGKEQACSRKSSKNAERYDTVKRIMHLIDKGASIDKIAAGLKTDKDFVSDVCRMYLTHRNVGVQGILDRIEIKGK